MLEDVLVISPFAGYANAGHAGAKTHYNYIVWISSLKKVNKKAKIH